VLCRASTIPRRARRLSVWWLDQRDDYLSEWAAIRAVSSRLGMNAETLRSWIRQQQVDDGRRDGISCDAAAEIRALKRRNAELEQTIAILKAATVISTRQRNSAWSLSAGVSKSRVWRGGALSLAAMVLRSSWVKVARLVPFGKY
jgi:transposase